MGRSVTAAFLAAALAVSSAVPVSAASSATRELSPVAQIDDIGYPSAVADASLVSDITAQIAAGTITVHADQDQLAVDAATQTTIDEGGTALTIPITGEGSEFSNLTVLLDDDHTVVTYTEAHFATFSEHSGHMKIWNDGRLSQDRTIVTTPSSGSPTEQISPLGFNEAYDALNQCLSAAGVPAWIIAAAGFVCTLANIPGVIACLIASGVGGYAAGKCARAAVDAW